MTEYYDDLVTRSTEVREQAQLEALRAQVEHARANT